MVTNYRTFHLTVIGATHIKNGTVCQDCSQSCEKTECRLVVVCDGHGGADYFRSDRGSKLAAAAFTDCMENPDLIAALSAAATEKQRKSRIEQLIKSIIARWNSLVEQDMRQENGYKPHTAQHLSAQYWRRISGWDFRSAMGSAWSYRKPVNLHSRFRGTRNVF